METDWWVGRGNTLSGGRKTPFPVIIVNKSIIEMKFSTLTKVQRGYIRMLSWCMHALHYLYPARNDILSTSWGEVIINVYERFTPQQIHKGRAIPGFLYLSLSPQMGVTVSGVMPWQGTPTPMWQVRVTPTDQVSYHHSRIWRKRNAFWSVTSHSSLTPSPLYLIKHLTCTR